MKRIMFIFLSTMVMFSLTACSVRFEVRNKGNNSNRNYETVEIN